MTTDTTHLSKQFIAFPSHITRYQYHQTPILSFRCASSSSRAHWAHGLIKSPLVPPIINITVFVTPARQKMGQKETKQKNTIRYCCNNGPTTRKDINATHKRTRRMSNQKENIPLIRIASGTLAALAAVLGCVGRLGDVERATVGVEGRNVASLQLFARNDPVDLCYADLSKWIRKRKRRGWETNQ
jgi:hypothetical protein